VQSINDIIGTYGVNNTILDNAHVVVAFATADVTSLERISRMTGMVAEYRESYSRPNRLLGGLMERGSVSESEHVRPLMTPGDVRELPYDEQLILINGTRPMRTKKVVYHRLPQFQRLIDEAGALPPAQGVRSPWQSDWLGESAKGRRIFHPLAAKLREELNRSDAGPENIVTIRSPATLPSLFDVAPEETSPGQPAHRTNGLSTQTAVLSQAVADANSEPAARSSAAAIADSAPAASEEKPEGIAEPAKEVSAVIQRTRRLI
jgi:type IV secretion system protein VirD4